ncbi:MAG: tyrosine-protein phosphatase [Novosphingobium sp.]|jgi:protein-tyrosine phosphatase|nr:tyrosine-protein phosphatase [Novosphingobium sp.]
MKALGLVLALGASPALAAATNAVAMRAGQDRVQLGWTAPGAVDVYLAYAPDAGIADATLVSGKDRDGKALVRVDANRRPYFLLRDTADGTVTEVSERAVPLARGSNFRDIGGYATADGRHVRWGLVYRSGGSAMLTPEDLAKVKALGLRNMVDLRSDEERVLAPTRIDGVAYAAVGYPMAALMSGMNSGTPQNGAAIYRGFPGMLAPQLRIVFDLLKRGQGPIAYNCSAGQDRTGFITALILSVLGVPRETIMQDYHLSTTYRQPQYEVPHIDLARWPDNAAAQMFGRYQDDPAMRVARPLREADGTPFLKGAFDEIEAKWGSVDAYLEQEVGVSAADRAELRRLYLR